MKAFAAILLLAAVAYAADYSQPLYRPVEYKPVYKKAEYNPVEYKPVDYKPVEYKPVEYKPVEYKKAEYAYPTAHYDFTWQSSAEPYTQYNHNEARKGDDTKGDFSSTAPDGHSASVVYTVYGDSGFVAKSQYEIKGDYAKSYDYKPKY